ncbi:hypothetical protein F5883DRAFT_578573 [Diaporthe sp. PMI_573]|nr:hypothetical protein F5883DRAFT_578573 [Diaporthaceae sp. PMI_573]
MGLSGMTDHEVKGFYDAMRRQAAASGMELSPHLTPRQAVEAHMAMAESGEKVALDVLMTSAMASDVTDLRSRLLDLQQNSPEAFGDFLECLRAAKDRA